jgi:cytochrome P450
MAYGDTTSHSAVTAPPAPADDLAAFSPTLDPATVAAPQPSYHRLQDEAPLLHTRDGVLLSRHEDVVYALRHPEKFSSAMEAIHLGNVRPLIPLQIDPPDHLKYRKLLDPLFAPREVNRLEGEVRDLTNVLIDAFAGDGEVEFTSAVAIPLPSTVFLALMGLPQDELPLFLSFKDGIIRPPGLGTAEGERARRETGRQIYAYFERVVEERRASPRDDLITRFTAAEVEGQRLSTEEILDICFLFIMAGLDTVTASLTCSMAYLATHPEPRRELASDPSLVPGAVEELLRWESVVPGVPRVLTDDVEIAGEVLPKGTRVHPLLGAANVDPQEFPDPDRVDFHREGNRHLAFGGGIHRCLGSHLARLELRIALEEWHRRIPEYELAPGEVPVYVPGLRTVDRLPLVFPT